MVINTKNQDKGLVNNLLVKLLIVLSGNQEVAIVI